MTFLQSLSAVRVLHPPCDPAFPGLLQQPCRSTLRSFHMACQRGTGASPQEQSLPGSAMPLDKYKSNCKSLLPIHFHCCFDLFY